MPIIEMCKKEDEGARAWNANSTDENERNVFIRNTWTGLCLRDSEKNGYNDSDFYMLVWDEEKGEPRSICFASTRGWTYPCYGSKVDATPEIRAKFEAWEKEKARKQAERAAAIEAAKPHAGRRVRFVRAVKGRKNKATKGAEGVVFWRGVNRYKVSNYVDYGLASAHGFDVRPYTVGVELDDGSKGFFDDKAVQVIQDSE